jgi:hypothetical protein
MGSATMKMKAPRTEAQVFDGTEITEFLDEYNRQTTNAGFSNKQKLLLLPDYCDNVRRSFVKKMRAYTTLNWALLQEDMKEHWRDNDTSQRRGTRAYLEAYVKQCSQSFPGISDYYTNFLVISDAGITAKQVHESERGFLFFKGLPRMDKELVLFSMPEPRPDGVDVATYDMDEIYKFVRKVYRQREGIKQTSYSQAEEDTRRAQLAVKKSQRVTPEDIKSAVRGLEELRSTSQETSVPPGVDQEVQDLIDAMKGVKISVAEVESLTRHPAVGPLLREGKNYVYFLSQVTRPDPPRGDTRYSGSSQSTMGYQPRGILSRNDGSFVTTQPRSLNPQSGTAMYNGREVRNTCNGCGDSGHFIRDCELIKHLVKMGWISSSYDKDTRRTTWFYGPFHKRLGEIIGSMPPTLVLHWLRSKVRDFFEVTDDMMDQPASACKPEKFEGVDSRPMYGRVPNQPLTSTPVQSGQGNTATNGSIQRPTQPPEVALAEFVGERILRGDDALEVITLNEIDSRDIVLARSGYAHAATRGKRVNNPPVDEVLDRVRRGQVQKRGRPQQNFDATRMDTQIMDESPFRDSLQQAVVEEEEMHMEEDSQTIPFPSQAHDNPFAVVKPPASMTSFGNLSADPDNLRPARKKKVQIEELSSMELRELLQSQPNRIPSAMFKQEVRGVTIADLLGEPGIRHHVEELMKPAEKHLPTRGEANTVVSGVCTGAVDQSDVAQFPKRDWPAPDWLAYRLAPTSPANLSDDENQHEVQAVKEQNFEEKGRVYEEVNVATFVNLSAQSRHQVTGTWDTYQEGADEATHREQTEGQKVRGQAFVQSELPTCWAGIGAHSIRCLIDTGAQMNLLRRSAALALRLPYSEIHPSDGEPADGVVTANGSLDPFLGTAFQVPVKIGQVVITTHFRIVENLTRSAILGAPWCASARLSLQYNIFGRVTCRIIDQDGRHNVVFIASDPAPHHPNHLIPMNHDEDAEN